MSKIPVRRFGKWISIEADIDQCSAMKAGKGCDPLPGLTCSGGRLVGGFTFFRSLAFSLPCALRSIGGRDRKSVVEGKRVSVRVEVGVRSIIQQKKTFKLSMSILVTTIDVNRFYIS